MDMFPDDDQQQIVDAVGEFCTRRFPMSTVRAQAERADSIEAEDWHALAELGCFSLGLSADLGGAELGLVGEMLVAREIGRRLVPGPLISTILAAHALGESLPSMAADVAQGSTRVALAEPYGTYGGEVTSYLVSDLVDGLVLVVNGPEWSVYPASACVDVTPATSLDPSVRLATAALSGGEPLITVTDEVLRSRAQVLVAATMCGVAAATTTASVEYAKTRKQFGQRIGSFQAVKHRCAEMAVRAEAAFSQTAYAALILDDAAADAQFQAAAARLIASAAAGDNCADNIQNHGGIGFTHECNAHLYLRRWRALDRTLGDRFDISDELARLEAAQ